MPDPTPKRVAVPIELHWNLPWHLDCYQGIVDYGREQGWACITDPYLTGATGDNDLSQYDGVVGRIDAAMAKRVAAAGVRAVTLLYVDDLHSVRSDSRGCARVAGEHLVGRGYRRLGHVGSTDVQSAVSRAIFETFSETVTTRGCPPPADTVFNADDLAHPVRSIRTRQAIAQWIQERDKPVGLYIHDMATARYLSQICEQLGLRVPEDVGIVVHSADKLTATSITPTLSEVTINHWEQAYQAASVLDRLMRGEAVEPRTRYVTQPRIITRESTDRFINEDAMISQAMHYIAEQGRRPLSAEDVAVSLGVSRRTLDRRFEQVLGKTVRQQIMRIRMEQIENMLIDSELPMADIAELFGIGSASQFTQYFKKHAGITPTAYRNQYKSKQ